MRPIPAPNGKEAKKVGPDRARLIRAILTAVASLILMAVVSVLIVVPAALYVLPFSPEAGSATLCLPGIGPLQRFGSGMRSGRDPQASIHEGVHAGQCRRFGASSYAQRVASPEGRLALEAEALCAEAAALSRRGGDRQRLLDLTVETLATEYFRDGSVPRREITVAVDAACGAVIGVRRPLGIEALAEAP
jgi:hypothetical protein